MTWTEHGLPGAHNESRTDDSLSEAACRGWSATCPTERASVLNLSFLSDSVPCFTLDWGDGQAAFHNLILWGRSSVLQLSVVVVSQAEAVLSRILVFVVRLCFFIVDVVCLGYEWIFDGARLGIDILDVLYIFVFNMVALIWIEPLSTLILVLDRC